MSSSRFHGWGAGMALAVIFAAVTLLVMSLLGEFVVRYREQHRSGPPGTRPTSYYRHERLRHAMVRGYDYFGWGKVNSLGLRGEEIPMEKPEGETRIMMVGGSTTFDPFVTSDDHAWPSRLQAVMDSVLPSAHVRVLNAGVPGYRVLDNLIRLQTELYQLDPDLIVLSHAHNDLNGFMRPRARRDVAARPGAVEPMTPWGRWLGDHSVLYGKLRTRWLAVRRDAVEKRASREAQRESASATNERITRGAQLFAHDLGGFLALATNLDVPVIVLQVVHISGPGASAEPDSSIRAIWNRKALAGSTIEAVLAGYTVPTTQQHDGWPRDTLPPTSRQRRSDFEDPSTSLTQFTSMIRVRI